MYSLFVLPYQTIAPITSKRSMQYERDTNSSSNASPCGCGLRLDNGDNFVITKTGGGYNAIPDLQNISGSNIANLAFLPGPNSYVCK